MLSTTASVELTIITIAVSGIFIIMLVVVIQALMIMLRVKAVLKKAERVIQNVESASEVLGQMGKAAKTRFPLFSFIHNLVNESKDKK